MKGEVDINFMWFMVQQAQPDFYEIKQVCFHPYNKKLGAQPISITTYSYNKRSKIFQTLSDNSYPNQIDARLEVDRLVRNYLHFNEHAARLAMKQKSWDTLYTALCDKVPWQSQCPEPSQAWESADSQVY